MGIEFVFLFIDSAIRVAVSLIVTLIVLARIRSWRERKHYTWLTVLFEDDE